MFPEWLKLVLFLLGYVVLMRWVLPAVGIRTCLSGACRIPGPRQPRTAIKKTAHERGADNLSRLG